MKQKVHSYILPPYVPKLPVFPDKYEKWFLRPWLNKLTLDLRAQSYRENQAADLKEREILSSSPVLCPGGFGSPEGCALETREGGAELGWAEWEGGHRPTRSGGWDNTGKFEKLDLHKNSQSSLVGFPLWAFALRHPGTLKRRPQGASEKPASLPRSLSSKQFLLTPPPPVSQPR